MKKINICFDGTVFFQALQSHTARTGIYWVGRNVLAEFSKRPDVSVYLYLDKKAYQSKSEILNDIGNISVSAIVSEDADLSNIDAFLSPLFKAPEFINKYPNISSYIILYDIIALLYPDYFTPDFFKGWYKELINNLNTNCYYFPISSYTKADFLKYFDEKLDSEKMTTILLSTNQAYKPNKILSQLSSIKEKYHIPSDKKYLFSLCSLEPRKNLIRAVKTFIQFIEKNKINDLVYVLGGNAWEGFIEKLEKEAPEYKKYTDKIIRAGYIADEDLEILYSNAEWFVYTSQYEGFGMPPLEAMACGCPVITSNNTSLPEVVGDAGQMIDWDNDEQHIAAYERYYFDQKYRDEMAQKGLARSKQFSWKKTVDIILNKMQEVEKKKAQKPLVTIITATYNLIKQNRKDTFIQSITSAHNQTYPNIEHIVIDGASTDGTLELLEEYQTKGWIKYYSAPDKGIYDAMNKGILKAKGKYVICLNSDDFYCDMHAVEWLVKKAEENDADACYADAVRVHPETLKIINEWKGDDNLMPWCNAFPCHQTFLIKTEIMKELGLYNLKYKVSADNAFFMRLCQYNKKIVGIKRNIICFRDGGFSNDHMSIARQDQIEGLFSEYGQYHSLTRLDVNNLIAHNFRNLPLDEAIILGSKLQNCLWIEQYFNILINSHQITTPLDRAEEVPSKFFVNFLLFNKLPIIKIKRDVNQMKCYFLRFIPLIAKKGTEFLTTIKVLGIPFIRINKNEAGTKIKYLFLGIPILKKQIYLEDNNSFILNKVNDKYLKQILFCNMPLYRKIKNNIPQTLIYGFDKEHQELVLNGFYNSENWGRWGCGNNYSIRFFNYSYQKAKLDVNVFLHEKHPILKTDVFVNGKKRTTWIFEQGKPLPDTTLELKPFRENVIKFDVKNPIAPKDVMDTPDSRLLGIGIKQIILMHKEKNKKDKKYA